MRVAIFTDSYVPQINGVVTQIRNITREMVARGHKVMIVAPSHDSRFRESKRGKITEFFLPSVSLPTYADYRVTHFFFPRITKELKSFKPDVVHVQTPFSVGWLGVNSARKLKIPVIGTYHTLLPEFLMYLPIPFLKNAPIAKTLMWKYTDFFYNRCDLVTTPTEAMKKELIRNGIKRGIEVLPNAIDFERFNKYAKKNYETKQPKLIYFGRIGYEKNIEVLIFALKRLLRKNKNVLFTITGSGPALGYLEQLVKAESLQSNVAFQSPLKDGALARHVAGHDIFVTASTIETQGLTILEAMAAGLPCVGADCMAIPDSIKEGRNGFLFKPFDFSDAAERTHELIRSSTLRKKLGRKAIETAKNFSVGKIAKMTEGLYAKMSAVKPKRNA